MGCRSSTTLAGALVFLAACNALTGVGDLVTSEGPNDASALVFDSSSVTDAGGLAPNDGGDARAPNTADASDAGVAADAAATDAAASDADAAPPPCTPVTRGPVYGSAASTTASPGKNWDPPNGILKPGDGNYVHTDNGVIGPANNNTLTVTGFDFKLPASAVIRGIRVEIARTASGDIVDDKLTLPRGKAREGLVWPAGPADGPFVTQAYGDATDLWDATWTAADFNASDFDVELKIKGDGDGHADSLGVVITYCVPGT